MHFRNIEFDKRTGPKGKLDDVFSENMTKAPLRAYYDRIGQNKVMKATDEDSKQDIFKRFLEE